MEEILRIALILGKLTTLDCYWSVANQFGVGRSTTRAVMERYAAIKRALCPQVIRLGSFALLGFPNCIGTSDGTQIPILCFPPPGLGVQQ